MKRQRQFLSSQDFQIQGRGAEGGGLHDADEAEDLCLRKSHHGYNGVISKIRGGARICPTGGYSTE